MGMVWAPVASAIMMASSLASFMTMLHLRFRWDVHVSCVRWLFWLFFLYVWLWSSLRAAYFFWLGMQTQAGIKPRDDGDSWAYKQVDHMGIHAMLYLRQASKQWLLFLYVFGDVALLGLAATLFPLTYELCRIARMSMDRGPQKECLQIRRYALGIHFVLLAFWITESVLVIVQGDYTQDTLRCLMSIYVVQFIGLVFMIGSVLHLKINGRKYETIHGTFIASPVYQRLKRIMIVYVVFAFQFQLSSFILFVLDPKDKRGAVEYIGVSQLIYCASGLALSITTSCSQSCVLTACSFCLPDDFEATLMHQRLGNVEEAPSEDDLEAPSTDPVFVFTDIESSSALWAIDDGQMMDQATEIHDNILRSTLPKYRGYEITTCGDAFQLAFHTIRDAVEYCMDVQLQLLVAKWPKDIHGAVPATNRRRSSHRLVFNGLRVRMGIHDACEVEGALVQDIHAVTGKAIYTGASEVTAQFVGDLGSGGQILVTSRVASWLKYRLDDLSVDFALERVGLYTVPQVNMSVEVFQVLPSILAGRMRLFPTPDKGRARLQHPLRPSRRGTSASQQSSNGSTQSREITAQYVSIESLGLRNAAPT
ncbi:hypothetical protein Poli38472_013738 [Pythium oligandrum]|uniref:Guanylate cyclase domain-containing protein n=1 Tax=Pythium oligandrum TaxID=41045 RepID=A0A8K1FF55_PYTOL|nr:hypothetical protein Poli38472_013738 [Pythium oligandrum]|eukprot:TMW61275.1 hypothetical protein Poli38472_013738 [Pythium oligandrum]